MLVQTTIILACGAVRLATRTKPPRSAITHAPVSPVSRLIALDGFRTMSTLSKTSKKRFDSPAQEVYLSLWRTYDRLRAIEDELFSSLDLTAQQYNVLRLLQAAAPNVVPTLQISGKMISRAPDITRMLDKLQERGLIDRSRSEEDRRAVLIGITAKGMELLAELADKVKKTHVAQVGHLSVEEMRSLCELLARVRDPHEPDGSDWKPKS